MAPHLENGRVERTRIEDGIREREIYLKKIDEQCSRLAVAMTERNLIRGLLASRQQVTGDRSRDPMQPYNSAVRQRTFVLKQRP